MRGAGGLSWNILMENIKSGISVHMVDENIDTGLIIKQKSFIFKNFNDCSLDKLMTISLKKQKEFLQKFINYLIYSKKFIIKKNMTNNTKEEIYLPRLSSRKHSWINWNWESKHIISFIKAFSKPYPGAKTFLNNKIVKISNATISKTKYKFHPFQNGLIYKVNKKNEIFVASINGGIRISNFF